MPEPKAPAKDAPKVPDKAAPLGSAAASTDPAVQDLIAARSIAVLNADKDAIAAIDGKLADLGVN